MRNDDILKWKRLVESINQMAAEGEHDAHKNSHPDHEVGMAKSQLLSSVKSATRIAKHLSHTSEEDGIEGWVASKITMAEDYLQVVADYMDGEHIRESVMESDEEDTVSMNVPLLLRIMEYAREDAKDDMDLHDVAERMVALSKDGSLSMEDYTSIVGDVEDTYDALDEAKSDKKDEFADMGFDPKTKKALVRLQAKFPHAKDALSAILADIKDSQSVSKKNDEDHDAKLKDLEQRLSYVEKEITLGENQDFHEEFGLLAFSEDENDLFEAEYQGRKVKLNKPMRGDVKKFKVYVKNEKGNIVKVNFGDPDMKIKKSNPKRRASFRARHNCDNPGPKTKARYWSCRKW